MRGAFDAACGWAIKDFMLTAFYMLLACSALMYAASKRFPEPLKEEAKDLVWADWREPLRGEIKGWVLGDYRVLAALVTVVFVVLYIGFR